MRGWRPDDLRDLGIAYTEWPLRIMTYIAAGGEWMTLWASAAAIKRYWEYLVAQRGAQV